jgi:hypothetical protein
MSRSLLIVMAPRWARLGLALQAVRWRMWSNVAMNDDSETNVRAGSLDQLTRTFTKDQDFCEALAMKQASHVARLFVYLRWAQNYLPAIQEELYAMADKHFSAAYAANAKFWTLANSAGTFRDLALVPYLVVRGLISQAGLAVRRSFENVGVLSILWGDPSTAEYLSEPDGGLFKNTFVREPHKNKAAMLKTRGLQKRFHLCVLGKPMSDLYHILSKYAVHGGSPDQLVTANLAPTRLACMFVNRPDPLEEDLTKELTILVNGCEMLCLELAYIHGKWSKQYGLQPTKGSEGGFRLTELLERGPDGDLSDLVRKTLGDLGWTPSVSP